MRVLARSRSDRGHRTQARRFGDASRFIQLRALPDTKTAGKRYCLIEQRTAEDTRRNQRCNAAKLDFATLEVARGRFFLLCV
jgi:hypothetical protein